MVPLEVNQRSPDTTWVCWPNVVYKQGTITKQYRKEYLQEVLTPLLKRPSLQTILLKLPSDQFIPPLLNTKFLLS